MAAISRATPYGTVGSGLNFIQRVANGNNDNQNNAATWITRPNAPVWLECYRSERALGCSGTG